MRRSIGRTAPRFLLVGVVNTIVGLSTIFFCKAVFDIKDAPANMIGYAFGLLTSFFLNRTWTFDFRGRSSLALARFLGVFVIAYLINLATVLSIVSATAVSSYWAHVIGVIPYTIFTFLANHFYVFAGSRESRDS